jgi:serine/threonine protein kinase
MQRNLEAGDEFAGYRIESFIARGGMAVVYRARDIHLDRQVALKVLAPELAEDDMFRHRFVRESRLAASIDHPHIIPIYQAGQVEDVLYLAMRYVPGPNLAGLLAQSGPLRLEQATLLFDQVAGALDAAHAHGLVHRDVKPENVLVAGTDPIHLYLADFGLTKRASSRTGLTMTGHFLGSVDYVAPEQISGQPTDARTDIYSLGCMLYEALTGHRPFERDVDAAIIYAHLSGPPPSVSARRPDLPPEVDRVVAAAMATDPDDRYPTCHDLVAALRETDASPPPPSGVPSAADTPSGSDGESSGRPTRKRMATPSSPRDGTDSVDPDRTRSRHGPPSPPSGPPRDTPPPAGPPGPPARTPRRRVGWFPVLLGGLLTFALAVLALYILRPGGTQPASSYVLEPAGTSAVPPYTPPVGTDMHNVTTPPAGGQNFVGDTPGLYAGTPNQQSCNGDELIRQLQADATKAATWSRLQGIAPADIPSFVSKLSGVNLRSDTYVYNHGYDNGRTTTTRSVLQAGTAVFVDSHGTPVVKCTCGNPVKPAEPPSEQKKSFIGQPWQSFSPNSITIVQQTHVTVEILIVVQIGDGVVFERPIKQWKKDKILDSVPPDLALPGVQGLPSPTAKEQTAPSETQPGAEVSPSETQPGAEASPSETQPGDTSTPGNEAPAPEGSVPTPGTESGPGNEPAPPPGSAPAPPTEVPAQPPTG